MSFNPSSSISGLPLPSKHPKSAETPSGCPFMKADPPLLRASETMPSNAPRSILLAGDDELSLAYQAVKSRRRSSMVSNKPNIFSKEAFNQDSLAAESRGHVSPPPSVTSASNCPIRFLGQLSPEEVAEYFKNHKHELPKSHESCVKRHQSNTESIRELDAKYVNLVSMIQGLGEKHQPLLPDKKDEGETIDKIEKWAAGLKDEPGGLEVKQGKVPEGTAGVCPVAQGEERGRGETQGNPQLREVRLGESPTRPWGLHVPPAAMSTASTPCAASESESQQNMVLTPAPETKPHKSNSDPASNFESRGNHPQSHQFPCPEKGCRTSSINQFKSFAELARHYLNEHDNTTNDSSRHKATPSPEESAPPKISTHCPSIYITGPVFIGYSAQEVMELSAQFSRGD